MLKLTNDLAFLILILMRKIEISYKIPIMFSLRLSHILITFFVKPADYPLISIIISITQDTHYKIILINIMCMVCYFKYIYILIINENINFIKSYILIFNIMNDNMNHLDVENGNTLIIH